MYNVHVVLFYYTVHVHVHVYTIMYMYVHVHIFLKVVISYTPACLLCHSGMERGTNFSLAQCVIE